MVVLEVKYCHKSAAKNTSELCIHCPKSHCTPRHSHWRVKRSILTSTQCLTSNTLRKTSVHEWQIGVFGTAGNLHKYLCFCSCHHGNCHHGSCHHGSYTYFTSWLHFCFSPPPLLNCEFIFSQYYSYLYSYWMPQGVREMVATHMNGEDIAMNFLVAHITGRPPVKVSYTARSAVSLSYTSGYMQWWLRHRYWKAGWGLGTRLARPCLLFALSVFWSWQVDSHGNFDCKTCHSGLSSHGGYYEERDECVNTAAKVWGFNPLLYTQTRVEPSMGDNHCLLSV